MNMNVLFICITIIICGILLAFCHYNEHKEDLSTDRFEYLVQQLYNQKMDLSLAKHEAKDQIDRLDSDIMNLDTRITSLGKRFDSPNFLD